MPATFAVHGFAHDSHLGTKGNHWFGVCHQLGASNIQLVNCRGSRLELWHAAPALSEAAFGSVSWPTQLFDAVTAKLWGHSVRRFDLVHVCMRECHNNPFVKTAQLRSNAICKYVESGKNSVIRMPGNKRNDPRTMGPEVGATINNIVKLTPSSWTKEKMSQCFRFMPSSRLCA
jgi:hypothetical protein